MNKKLLYGLVAMLAGSGLQAQDETAVQQEIATAREVIAQYVNTRQAIARVSNEWKAYQELTQRRVDLYQREIDQLRKAIMTAEAETTQAEREIARIRDDIRTLRDSNNVVLQALPEMENKLRELYQYFPAPLKNKVQRLVQQLGRGRQASDRMAVLIGVLNEVDKFNAEFSFDTIEKVLPGGETRLVDVIYLGLGMAYYADKEGRVGGVGVPAEGEWKWTERNDLAPGIRMAVRYYNSEIKPAMMVELPIEIHNLTVGK